MNNADDDDPMRPIIERLIVRKHAAQTLTESSAEVLSLNSKINESFFDESEKKPEVLKFCQWSSYQEQRQCLATLLAYGTSFPLDLNEQAYLVGVFGPSLSVKTDRAGLLDCIDNILELETFIIFFPKATSAIIQRYSGRMSLLSAIELEVK